MSANVLVVHGGGPTAVINASLYGVVEEAKSSGSIGRVYGAIGGSEGILKENFLDLMQYPEEKLSLLLQTPATAIGSSRYALKQEDYNAMAGIFRKYGIRYVLLNGGNGTMDTCGRIFEACRGEDIYVVGIPKTIDNVKALPIHVCVMEAMGRNAGWITAASALARKKPGDAPHLIYLPERPFHEEEFLEDVKRLYDEKGGVVVVASEGLKNEKGEPIVPPIFKVGRATYYGDVSAYLANLVIQKLGIKARSEKPGLCGRASIAWQSPVDRDEAVLAGRQALRTAMAGRSGVMVGLIRDEKEDGGYHVHTSAIPIKEVMLHERVLPDEYINDRGNDVTDAFLKWCRPLIGPELRDFVDFKEEYEKMGVGK